MRPPGRSRIGCVKEAKGWVEEKTTRPREKPNRGTSVALLSATGPILRHTRGMGGHVMRTSLAATVGSTLLAVALTAGLAGAQSGTATDTTKDSSAPSTQTDQSSQQPAQPSQPGREERVPDHRAGGRHRAHADSRHGSHLGSPRGSGAADRGDPGYRGHVEEADDRARGADAQGALTGPGF